MRQIVLDTETTGLNVKDGHRIIEIACLEVVTGRYKPKRYHTRVNPQREIESGATKVHGFTSRDLVGAPVFSAVAADLLEFIDGAELLIHNAQFDVAFLDAELDRMGLRGIEAVCTFTDTLAIARQLHPGQNNSIDALCKRYGIAPNPQPSCVQQDVELVARIYLAMTGKTPLRRKSDRARR